MTPGEPCQAAPPSWSRPLRLALVVAALVATLVLGLTGDDVAGVLEHPLAPLARGARNLVNILNAASILYLSGVAAAIGFRMNLFNIGVEGQYPRGDLRRRGVRGDRPGSRAA